MSASGEFRPSPMQQAIFDWIEQGEGSAIVEAVAGSGKTTTMMQGIRRMRGRVIYLVYNKKNDTEAKERLAKDPELRSRGADPRSADAVFFKTFHSVGYSALRFALGKQHRLEPDDKKVQRIADDIVAGGPGREPRYDLAPLVTTVVRMVGMAKNRGIGALEPIDDYAVWADMVEHYDLDADLPEDARLDQVVAFARCVLKRSNKELDTIDFDDMVYLPVLLKLRLLKHDWVIVDEYQDSNPTRRRLAAMLLGPHGRMVVVGDRHQAIYGFTGADNDAMDSLPLPCQATYLPLSVSYRCPRAVVAHAQQWVSHIEAHEGAADGSVTETEYARLFRSEDGGAGEARPGDAVLCRYNKHLVTACFKLIREGVPAKIEGRSIGEGLIKLATRWKSIRRLPALREKLDEYLRREVAKAIAREDEAKADRVTDQVETLRVLIDRAEEQGAETVEQLQVIVRSMFEDDAGSRRDVVVLCSAHKSKGLEWDRVFLLGREQLMPSRRATKAWVLEQERNLIYVAVTRAKSELVEVVGVPV